MVEQSLSPTRHYLYLEAHPTKSVAEEATPPALPKRWPRNHSDSKVHHVNHAWHAGDSPAHTLIGCTPSQDAPSVQPEVRRFIVQSTKVSLPRCHSLSYRRNVVAVTTLEFRIAYRR